MWQSQSIQFVWFLANVSDIKTSQFFETLAGEEPSSYQTNRIPGPANPFFAVASGAIGSLQAVLQLQPGRLDLIISPKLDDDGAPDDAFPTIETEKSVRQISERLALLPSISSVVRLAVVLNLFEQTENIEAARNILEKKIGYNPPFGDYSDFLFQINKTKPMSFDRSLLSNRLLRYSVMKVQSFMLQPTGDTNLTSVPVTKEYVGSALTVDVNTVPTANVFASETIIPIFNALADEALRIASSGEMITLRG